MAVYTCSTNIKIRSTDGTSEFDIPKNYIGTVPKWVEDHWYFQAHARAKNVLMVASQRDSAIEEAQSVQSASAKATQLDAQVKEKVKQAKVEAKEKATKEAADLGYDAVTTKQYVRSAVENAAAAAETSARAEAAAAAKGE